MSLTAYLKLLCVCVCVCVCVWVLGCGGVCVVTELSVVFQKQLQFVNITFSY